MFFFADLDTFANDDCGGDDDDGDDGDDYDDFDDDDDEDDEDGNMMIMTI